MITLTAQEWADLAAVLIFRSIPAGETTGTAGPRPSAPRGGRGHSTNFGPARDAAGQARGIGSTRTVVSGRFRFLAPLGAALLGGAFESAGRGIPIYRRVAPRLRLIEVGDEVIALHH